MIFRFYDKNLWFRRSWNKPSQIINGSTDFQYQYVKIKRIKARTFFDKKFNNSFLALQKSRFTKKFLQNLQFWRSFWVNRLFCSAKKILSKFFVRTTKYTKISVLLSSLFWHIDIENLFNRFKAAMVSLETYENQRFCGKFWLNWFYCKAKKMLSNFFRYLEKF